MYSVSLSLFSFYVLWNDARAIFPIVESERAMDKRRDSARDSQLNGTASDVAVNKGTRRCKCRHTRPRITPARSRRRSRRERRILLCNYAPPRRESTQRIRFLARRAASFLYFAICLRDKSPTGTRAHRSAKAC